jgi:hypothetical protein
VRRERGSVLRRLQIWNRPFAAKSSSRLAAALHDAYALEALARAFAELGRNALAAATLDKLLASSVASAPGIALDRVRAARRAVES